MRTYVIDIETLGTRPGCVILSIGAVEIDWEARAPVKDRAFYRRIDVASCLNVDLKVDADTVAWWFLQEPSARAEALLGGPRVEIGPALDDLTEFLAPEEPVGGFEVYGNGPSFDLSILVAAYEATGREVPWSYYAERCVRTEKAVLERRRQPWQKQDNPQRHHALYDAMCEALELCANCNGPKAVEESGETAEVGPPPAFDPVEEALRKIYAL